MIIAEQRLLHDDGFPVPFVRSPNMSGPLKKQDFIIIHFTEGQTAEAAIRVLSKRKRDRSAHIVIGRDGAVTQLVPFDITAWHTGPSSWKDRNGLAPYSIGIELDNAGPMVAKGGRWIASFGRAYPPDQVLQAQHKHGGRYRAWHTYPHVLLRPPLRWLRPSSSDLATLRSWATMTYRPSGSGTQGPPSP
jgi:N-acetylmuramoyl-L-alanine amidase